MAQPRFQCIVSLLLLVGLCSLGLSRVRAEDSPPLAVGAYHGFMTIQRHQGRSLAQSTCTVAVTVTRAASGFTQTECNDFASALGTLAAKAPAVPLASAPSCASFFFPIRAISVSLVAASSDAASAFTDRIGGSNSDVADLLSKFQVKCTDTVNAAYFCGGSIGSGTTRGTCGSPSPSSPSPSTSPSPSPSTSACNVAITVTRAASSFSQSDCTAFASDLGGIAARDPAVVLSSASPNPSCVAGTFPSRTFSIILAAASADAGKAFVGHVSSSNADMAALLSKYQLTCNDIVSANLACGGVLSSSTTRGSCSGTPSPSSPSPSPSPIPSACKISVIVTRISPFFSQADCTGLASGLGQIAAQAPAVTLAEGSPNPRCTTTYFPMPAIGITVGTATAVAAKSFIDRITSSNADLASLLTQYKLGCTDVLTASYLCDGNIGASTIRGAGCSSSPSPSPLPSPSSSTPCAVNLVASRAAKKFSKAECNRFAQQVQALLVASPAPAIALQKGQAVKCSSSSFPASKVTIKVPAASTAGAQVLLDRLKAGSEGARSLAGQFSLACSDAIKAQPLCSALAGSALVYTPCSA